MQINLRVIILLACLSVVANLVCAQVGINTDGSQPAPSAILDVKSASKGFLPPRMYTIQRNAIVSPEIGLMIYNIDCGDIQFFNGAAWVPVSNSQLVGNIPEIAGNHTPCPNSINETYSISDTTENPYYIGYNWTVPEGAVITSGQGTTSITVNFGTHSGYIYVQSYDNCWKSRAGMFRISLGAPVAPAQGTHVAYEGYVVWTWNKVYGAAGYKWNVTNDYGSAQDMNTDTSKTEANLLCNTLFTRYVWAYNTCTHSIVSVLVKSTATCSPPCPGLPSIVYGGKTYHTVQIGAQCWLKENLNIGTKISASSDQVNNNVIEKYCYNNLDSNCDVYGGLYQWGETVQYLNGASNLTDWDPTPQGYVTGICPPGWHLPSNVEWATLGNFLGGTPVAGGKMKEGGNLHWSSPNTGGTDISGFTGLPGGMSMPENTFFYLHEYAIFWSTDSDESHSSPRGMEFYMEYLLGFYSLKSSGNSVRCVRN